MFLTKKKKAKLQHDLAVLSKTVWSNKDVNVTKAICEICVICNLSVDKVFEGVDSESLNKEVFIDIPKTTKKTRAKKEEK